LPEEKTNRLKRQRTLNRAIASSLVSLGLVSLLVAATYSSSILAFIGLSLTNWGALLLYLAPSKQVSIELLEATTMSGAANIEKLLESMETSFKGVYLPPRFLKDFDSSLIYVPSTEDQHLPLPEEVKEEKLFSKNPNGLFLTPPGIGLSKLIEKKLETSFTRMNLEELLQRLPKPLVEDLEIAQDINTQIEGNSITVEITDNALKNLCTETRKLPKLHKTVGCPLSSALACALAKSTGKPVTIENEEEIQEKKTTKILYHIKEE
jgi:hypothetical protein